MPINSDISELFERYTRIEHEIKLLQEDRKHLLAEFKDRVDAKTFQSALRSAKIKAKGGMIIVRTLNQNLKSNSPL